MDWFAGLLDRLSGMFHNSRIMRSGFMSVLVVIVVLLAAGGAWYEHIQGNFHKIRVVPVVQDKPTGARPGNMALVQLVRTPVVSTVNPEFISATAAPGIGMEVMQATITLPGQRDVPLLITTANSASGELTDASEGSPVVVDVAPGSGRQWEEAVDVLRHRQAERVTTTATSDGMTSEALFSSASTGNAAPSGIETTVSTAISNRSLHLIVIAKNVSLRAHAVTISWEPLLAIAHGGMTMVPPRIENAHTTSAPAAIALSGHSFKQVYTKLRQGFLSDGTEVQLRDEQAGYILHLMALSPSIRSLRVETPQGGNSVLLAFSTASGEPGDDAQTMLQPGETLHLEIRLQVTPITARSH